VSKTAFLFPGQGAQHVGMGKAIVEKSTAARALFEQASEILGYDLGKLCFEGPSEKLDTTEVSQPAIYVTSLACLEILKAENPAAVEACSITAGLSLGEYTALVFAGAMSFADGLRVVQKRGQAMQAAADATPSGMVSILLLDREKVLELCRQASDIGPIQIANNLCPGNIVVSGSKAACEKIAGLAPGANGRAIPLSVAGAFHTDIMRPADQQLAAALANVELKTANSCDFERRCRAALRPGRNSRYPRSTGVESRHVGRFHPLDAGTRCHAILRNRTWQSSERSHEADRTQAGRHHNQRFTVTLRVVAYAARVCVLQSENAIVPTAWFTGRYGVNH
jgi:[acyl-carrier-protein] S-malonyltransferase